MTYNIRKLVELRGQRHQSQAGAAAAVGVSQATLSRWENGEAEPNSEYRAAYAKALGITVEELGRIIYGGTSPSQPAPQRAKTRKAVRS